MSMTQTVADIIEEHGPQSLTTIPPLAEAEGVTATREQLKAALANAKHQGKLVTIGFEPRRGKTPGCAIYAMAPDAPAFSGPPVFTPERPRPVASVWELGTRAGGMT